MELINAKENLELLTQLSKVNAALTSNNQVIAEQSHQLEKLNATKDKFFLVL
jgi:predicted  nucleic acid-binding Zn-ribbon protein